MKLHLFCLFTLALLLGNVAHAVQYELFERNLYFGLRGDTDVMRLQQILTDQGYYRGPVNGNFFGLTKAAVIAFQSANRVPTTGYFGPLSRAAIRTLPGESVEISPKSSDNAPLIASLRQKLADLFKQLALIQGQQTSQSATTTLGTTSSNFPIETLTSATTTSGALSGEVAPGTTTLPISENAKSFVSTLRIIVMFPSLTLSRYSNVTLTEFVLSAQENVTLTRLRFKNNGTLSDISLINIKLLNSKTGAELASVFQPSGGTIDFILSPDMQKLDQGLLVSGNTYSVTADILTPNYGGEKKPTIRLDIENSLDISAFDAKTLQHKAILDSIIFPVVGPTISTF